MTSAYADQDKPDAKELALGSATIEFDHVAFEYTRGAQVLRSISFHVEGGQTCALVRQQYPCSKLLRALKVVGVARSERWQHIAR